MYFKCFSSEHYTHPYRILYVSSCWHSFFRTIFEQWTIQSFPLQAADSSCCGIFMLMVNVCSFHTVLGGPPLVYCGDGMGYVESGSDTSFIYCRDIVAQQLFSDVIILSKVCCFGTFPGLGGDDHEMCGIVIPQKCYSLYSCCMGYWNGSIDVCNGGSGLRALLSAPSIDLAKALKYTNVKPIYCMVFKQIHRLFNWCLLLDGDHINLTDLLENLDITILESEENSEDNIDGCGFVTLAKDWVYWNSGVTGLLVLFVNILVHMRILWHSSDMAALYENVPALTLMVRMYFPLSYEVKCWISICPP